MKAIRGYQTLFTTQQYLSNDVIKAFQITFTKLKFRENADKYSLFQNTTSGCFLAPNHQIGPNSSPI